MFITIKSLYTWRCNSPKKPMNLQPRRPPVQTAHPPAWKTLPSRAHPVDTRHLTFNPFLGHPWHCGVGPTWVYVLWCLMVREIWNNHAFKIIQNYIHQKHNPNPLISHKSYKLPIGQSEIIRTSIPKKPGHPLCLCPEVPTKRLELPGQRFEWHIQGLRGQWHRVYHNFTYFQYFLFYTYWLIGFRNQDK